MVFMKPHTQLGAEGIEKGEFVPELQKKVVRTSKVLRLGFYSACILNGIMLGIVVGHLLLLETADAILWVASTWPLVMGVLMTAFFYVLTRLAYQLEQEVEQNVFVDKLTGAYNFHYLSLRIEEEIGRVERGAVDGFYVLFLDLDNFKVVNDNYGHAVGNLVLQGIVFTIGRLLRRHDVFCRIGGDEFVLLMPEVCKEEVEAVCKRLIGVVKNYSCTAEKGVDIDFVGISMGVARYPDNGDTGMAVLSAADCAVYKAKELGGNRFSFARHCAQEGSGFNRGVSDESPKRGHYELRGKNL